MKISYRLAGTALIALTFWTVSAWAETRYVSDQLVVSLRNLPQPDAETVTHLKTDAPVTVLEETGDHVKVKTKAGEVGYIKSYYLTPETPKAEVITRLQRERDRLVGKIEEMKQQLAAANSRGDQSQQELSTQLSESTQLATELQKKLATSEESLVRTRQEYLALQKDANNVIGITRERDQLRKTNQELTASISTLKDKVESLAMTGLIKWFLAGAGVLLLGMIIGKLSGGRRRSTF